MQFIKANACLIVLGLFLAYLPVSFYRNDGIGAPLAGGSVASLLDPAIIFLGLAMGVWSKADWRGLISSFIIAGSLGAFQAIETQKYYNEAEPLLFFTITIKFIACLFVVCVSGYITRLMSKS